MAPSFARRVWTVRQTLFPSFEPKGYHLQFRHATLITAMLICAAFTLPANPQTKPFADSFYFEADGIPVVRSYELLHRVGGGIMNFNIAVAAFIAVHLLAEPQFKRGAPVWYELFWMTLVVIGESVSLGLMAASRPPVCNFHFGVDATHTTNNKFTAKNSATSICSNWRGMTGMLGAIVFIFVCHMLWHTIVSIRFARQRQSVLTLPITDYRWTLPKELQRINTVYPGDIEAAAPAHETKQHSLDYPSSSFPSTEYKPTMTDTLSFPASTASQDYNNYSRPSAPMNALPTKAAAQPVVSTETQSDASSSVGSDRDVDAPFSNYARRV